MLLATLLASPVMAQRIDLPRPGPREFILDKANLLSAADRQTVRALCDRLLTDKATPIIVVTINSMADHGGADLRIETFATLLFDQWQIGHAKLGERDWNTGILLLVSRLDRRARIELGAGWARDKDAEAQLTAAIEAFTKDVGVLYMKSPQPNAKDPADYTVDHSAQLVLVSPDGAVRGMFRPPLDPNKIAADLRALANEA